MPLVSVDYLRRSEANGLHSHAPKGIHYGIFFSTQLRRIVIAMRWSRKKKYDAWLMVQRNSDGWD